MWHWNCDADGNEVFFATIQYERSRIRHLGQQDMSSRELRIILLHGHIPELPERVQSGPGWNSNSWLHNVSNRTRILGHQAIEVRP